MGTKNNPGDFDCYKYAKDDEPIFVLLGRDPSSPFVIRKWARRYKLRHQNGKFTPEQEKQFEEALQCARDMEEYYSNIEKATLALADDQLKKQN